MNRTIMMTRAGVTISDISRLTGIHRSTIKKFVLAPNSDPSSSRAAVLDELFALLESRMGTHFPLKRKAGELDSDRLPRLMEAFRPADSSD